MPDMDTARSEHLPQGPVVDADWLADHLDDVVVVDASIMGERGAATGIPGARRFDLDGPLSDQEADIPHTMLGADDFAQRLGELIKYGMIVVSTIPLLIVLPFMQKHFTKGALLGAVKS